MTKFSLMISYPTYWLGLDQQISSAATILRGTVVEVGGGVDGLRE